jgi:hypothetical protein
MSAIIKVYSNHGLEILDYFQGIHLIEKSLGIKIQNLQEVKSTPTDDLSQVIYYTNHEYFSNRYKDRWPIYIYSNFSLCNQIRIYNHFIDFEISGQINLKSHIWRDLIINKFFFDTLNEWNNSRRYFFSMARKLKGDTIIYLNDGTNRMTLGEEAIWNGETFENVINKLNFAGQPIMYNDLDNGVGIYDNENWFIEKL